MGSPEVQPLKTRRRRASSRCADPDRTSAPGTPPHRRCRGRFLVSWGAPSVARQCGEGTRWSYQVQPVPQVRVTVPLAAWSSV